MLLTQPNENRCRTTTQHHFLDLPPCCPISGNPMSGSSLEIKYTPRSVHLEVQSLRAYVDSYVGGRGEIRSMEGMIQQIAQDCADATGAAVYVRADLNLNPGQKMRLDCAAHPSKASATVPLADPQETTLPVAKCPVSSIS